jgi:alanine racemase
MSRVNDLKKVEQIEWDKVMQTAEAVIDLGAIRHNYHFLKSRRPGCKAVAVIKANAYGHNAIKVAQTLPDADGFAVSRLPEAVALRDAGIEQPIILLEGCFCADELVQAAKLGIQTLIHSEVQLSELEQAHLVRPIQCWIKVDTGMHRLGFAPGSVDAVHQRLTESPNARDEIGFVSHFSCADELDSAVTAAQTQCFEQATQAYSGPKSLSNSAGILHWPEAAYDWIRPGIALYGVAPRAESCGAEEGLIPVMTLKTRVIAVRQHKAGDPIGYGQTWTAPQDTTIGVIAMGYGDGYPRMAPSGTPVLVNGRRVPLVGRVSMDMITVDLGPDASDQVGDSVELFGPGLPVEEVSRHIGTLGYELVIKLTSRVIKTYIGE